jgi:hypothetical protein
MEHVRSKAFPFETRINLKILVQPSHTSLLTCSLNIAFRSSDSVSFN